MASPQRVPAPALPSLQLVGSRPAAGRAGVPRAATTCGRSTPGVAPAVGRRDPVRPGGRAARSDGLTGLRPVRGGCVPEPMAARASARAPSRGDDVPPTLRLTERGRRVVAGLSVAIGLSIAAATVVVVQVGGPEGGLQLAGASTVVVQPGDTLWSLARELAPEEDTRAVVDEIVSLNGLQDVDLMPGAVLQLP